MNMPTALVLLASYLLGSIPFAYIWSKRFKGIDIREVGSGNVGTTNVVLNVGWIPGILTAICDAGKGMLAVHLARVTLPEIPWAQLAAVFFAVVGHNWSVWLNFEGGGGLATYVGGLLLISAVSVLYLGLVWGSSFLLTGHKYAASVLTCALMPVFFAFIGGSVYHVWFGISMGVALGIKQVVAWFRVARTA